MGFLYYMLLIVISYFTFSTIYLFVLAISGNVSGADDKLLSTSAMPKSLKKIAVLIPAYKEDKVIFDSIETNLRQDYPSTHYDIIVIADSFNNDTLLSLKKLPITILEVSFEFSTVTKSLNAALLSLPEKVYDIVVVSDADNHMATDFLSKINIAFCQGWKAVQGHRVAKNSDTSIALLDAISEEINNHIFRKGYRALNLSASIIGSGMAIDFELMKKAMSNLVTVGGFDKELEMKLAIEGCKVGYLEKAYIYDEKVTKRTVFESQRTRWIAAQWQFLYNYFKPGIYALLAGRMVVASKIIQAMILPKVLLIGLLSISFMLSFLYSDRLLSLILAFLLIILCVGIIISIPAYLLKRVSMNDIFMVVILMISFARATLNIRKAYKSFIHTPHNT